MFFIKLLITFSALSAVLLGVKGQLELPGVEDAEPEDPKALQTLLECGQATNEILQIPAVRQALVNVRNQALAILVTEDNCETEGDNTLCSLNYEEIDTSPYKESCEDHKGVFNENNHSVACLNPTDPSSGSATYAFQNFPTCFSTSCEADDIERWIADQVDDFEFDVETDTSWLCDSDYTIEVPSMPTYSIGPSTCPSRVNDSVEQCGKYENNLESQQCDCYSFCDGVLAACEKFNDPDPAEVFCPGELIMGCTVAKFIEYSEQQEAKYFNKGSNSASVSGSLAPFTYFLPLLFTLGASWMTV